MPREVIGIELNDEKLKFARIQGLPRKKEIVDLVLKDIRGLSDNEISNLLKTSLREVGARHPNVVCSIFSRSVMTKNIEVPSRDPKEIQEIINLQSGRFTPYAKEEIIIDYINIGVYKQNYTKILLVIVPQKIIKRYLEILNRAGLREIEKISIAPEGICRIHPYISKSKAEDIPVAIIHISDIFTDFMVSLRKKMIFVRHIPMGVQNFLTEKENFKQKFTEEVKKSLESYQSEDVERIPGEVILTGAIKEIGEIKPILDSSLYLPTNVVHYLEHLPIKKDTMQFASEVEQTSFLDIISLLFVSDELTINLVPQEIKLRKTLEERGREIIKMGVLIMAAFALVCGILMSKIYFKNAYSENLAVKYESTNQEAQSLQESLAMAQTVKNYLSGRGYSLEVLSELYGVIPPDIYLDNIKFSGEGELSIKGTSVSMSKVFTLVSEMEKSKYFQNVKTKYTTKREEEEKNLTDFQITCTLNGGLK